MVAQNGRQLISGHPAVLKEKNPSFLIAFESTMSDEMKDMKRNTGWLAQLAAEVLESCARQPLQFDLSFQISESVLQILPFPFHIQTRMTGRISGHHQDPNW